MRPHSWRQHVLALALYAVTGVAFAWPLPAQLSTRLPGRVSGDTGVYVWNLWIFRHELVVERHLPLTTWQIFAMDRPVDLSQHNYAIFADVLALPLLSFVTVAAAYNVILIVVTIITAYAMFLLARAVLNDHPRPPPDLATGWPAWAAAWLAGVLFAFSPALVARSTEHLSLVIGAPLAAFTLTWLRALRSGRVRWSLAAGASMAWALFSDPYYGVYCVLLGVFFLVSEHVEFAWYRRPPSAGLRRVGWAMDGMLVALALLVAWIGATGGGTLRPPGLVVRAQTLYTPVLLLSVVGLAALAIRVRPTATLRTPIDIQRDAMVIATAGVSFGLLTLPILWKVARNVLTGQYVYSPVFWRSSMPGVDALAFLMPNPNHPLFGAPWRHVLSGLPGGFAENVASLTYVALAVLLFAVARDGFRPPRVWVSLTLLSASLAVGPFLTVGSLNTCIPTPWTLLRYVPLVGGAHAPARFTAVVMMGMSVMFALAVRHVLTRGGARQRLLGAAIAGALMFELSPAPRTVYSAEIPSIYRTIAADPRPVLVLELPFGARDGLSSTGNFSAATQYYQTFHGKRLLGGYLSRVDRRRHARLRRAPLRGALIRLSEGRSVPSNLATELKPRAEAFWRRRLGYVVIDRARATPALVEFAIRVFDLEKIGESDERELYRPRPLDAGASASPGPPG